MGRRVGGALDGHPAVALAAGGLVPGGVGGDLVEEHGVEVGELDGVRGQLDRLAGRLEREPLVPRAGDGLVEDRGVARQHRPLRAEQQRRSLPVLPDRVLHHPERLRVVPPLQRGQGLLADGPDRGTAIRRRRIGVAGRRRGGRSRVCGGGGGVEGSLLSAHGKGERMRLEGGGGCAIENGNRIAISTWGVGPTPTTRLSLEVGLLRADRRSGRRGRSGR